MLLTISCLNENGVYHLDIKPDNVLIGKFNGTFNVKILDFGHGYLNESKVSIHLDFFCFRLNSKALLFSFIIIYKYF